MEFLRIFIFSLAVLSLNLTSVHAQPDTLSVLFSHPAGFYNSPFTLTLTSPDAAAHIIYTLDCSNPQTSFTAITAGTQVTITVDPASIFSRAKTPAFLVRASLKWAGYTPSLPETRTYIFLDKVKSQKHPGGEWPTENVNNQYIDLEMDDEVVYDSRYAYDMDDALLDIPSISLVLDLDSLFDPSGGIYVNAEGHGPEWERFCSVELINPDGSPGFQENAGLRIRGGWSRHDNFPKHAFRLFFREEYGTAKLEYPLFGDEGVNQFDKVDLRCEQNYAWANSGGEHNTMVREVFSRDTQRDMGQPYTRSRYYHLYLNGMYWGIYQTQERSEARFASDYLGDSSTDYDVIKVNTENYVYRIEASDGNLANWQKIYNMCNTGFSDNVNYFKLEGKDADGRPLQGSEVMVDIDNLIDYMLTIFYTGNFDAPTTAFRGNSDPNNFYAVDNRNDKSKGFVFFNHDAEHTMMVDPVSPGTGLNENRVNISMYLYDFSQFHPQWLHYKLSSNEEYRIRFADRVLLHMTGNGALTPSQSLERFNKRVAEIDNAVIAESARWGDAQTYTPYTKDDSWLPEINTIQTEFFPKRTAIVLDQLKQAKLYPGLNPPKVSYEGMEIIDPLYNMGSSGIITIQNPNTTGNVYYTADGSDPREAGGGISARAVKLKGDYYLTVDSPLAFKARVYNGIAWSALRQIKFLSPNNEFTHLKVTELHYHPQDIIKGIDTVSGKYYEFIEFKNTGESAINLSGLVLDSAVYYEFPVNYLLPPGKFYVIAAKPSYFYEKYGMIPSGNYRNFFDNAGEFVLLKGKPDNEIYKFYYDDEIPFPGSADGQGYTLTASEKNPTLGMDDYLYWMASSVIDGSPFADDPTLVAIESIASTGNGIFKMFPNPCGRYLMVESGDESISGIHNLTFASLTGSVVYQCTFADNITIDLAGILPVNGLYMVTITGENNTYTGKIIYAP